MHTQTLFVRYNFVAEKEVNGHHAYDNLHVNFLIKTSLKHCQNVLLVGMKKVGYKGSYVKH